jgi:hypothetical protein
MYSEGARFESGNGECLNWARFCGFSQSLQENYRIITLIGHDWLLPNPFELIIHQSFYPSKLCSLTTGCVVKYLTEVIFVIVIIIIIIIIVANKLAEAVILLICFTEVPSSNLGRGTYSSEASNDCPKFFRS